MKIFLTGYSGTLGTALAELLIKRGHQLRGLLHAAAIDNRTRSSTVEIVWGTLSRPDLFDEMTKGMDVVVHCAWERRGAAEGTLEKANFGGTVSLIESAERNKVRTFVHISSVGVYGLDRSLWGKVVDESYPLVGKEESIDPYPLVKVLIEKRCEELRGKLEMNLVVIRPGLLFSDTKAPAKRLIRSKNKRYGVLVGNGKNHLPYIHVNDVAEMVSRVIEQPARYGVYNCVPAKHLPAADFLSKWGEYGGQPVKVLRLSPPLFRAATWSVHKLKSILRPNSTGANISYQILTGMRDIRYSADKAIQELGWQDTQSRAIATGSQPGVQLEITSLTERAARTKA